MNVCLGHKSTKYFHLSKETAGPYSFFFFFLPFIKNCLFFYIAYPDYSVLSLSSS